MHTHTAIFTVHRFRRKLRFGRHVHRIRYTQIAIVIASIASAVYFARQSRIGDIAFKLANKRVFYYTPNPRANVVEIAINICSVWKARPVRPLGFPAIFDDHHSPHNRRCTISWSSAAT